MSEVDSDKGAESGFSGKDTAGELITGMPKFPDSVDLPIHPEFIDPAELAELAASFTPGMDVRTMVDGKDDYGWKASRVVDGHVVISKTGDSGVTQERTEQATVLAKMQPSWVTGREVTLDGVTWHVAGQTANGEVTIMRPGGEDKAHTRRVSGAVLYQQYRANGGK